MEVGTYVMTLPPMATYHRYYWAEDDLPAALLPDVVEPTWAAPLGRPFRTLMWWTAEAAATQAHYDEYENIIYVVQVRACTSIPHLIPPYNPEP